MRHRSFSVPTAEAGLSGARSIASQRHRLLTAILLSVSGHVIVMLFLVFLPSTLLRDTRQREQGTVELLMVEQKGTQPKQAAPSNDSRASTRAMDKAQAARAQTAPAASKTPIMPPAAKHGDEPGAPPVSQTSSEPAAAKVPPIANQRAAQPAPPRSQEAPVFNLEGTGSESNAIVLGGHVLPAMPDDSFRNRPPAYPPDAALLGQHGTVTVIIHVSEDGLATSVDVLESSGVEELDQAAVTAVRKWHFHPAMRDGRTIPSDMPFRFVFQSY